MLLPRLSAAAEIAWSSEKTDIDTLRRRIRDPQLTLEGHKVSDCSRADVVLCYLENKVDRKLLERCGRSLQRSMCARSR